MIRQGFVRAVVIVIVGQVDEVALLCSDFFDLSQGFVEAKMGGVRCVAQSVDEQQVQIFEQAIGLVGDAVRVREPSGVADAVILGHGTGGAVTAGDGLDRNAHTVELVFDNMGIQLRDKCFVSGCGIKNVRKFFDNVRNRGAVAVNRENGLLVSVVDAQLVDAMDVIGMGVGIEHGVDVKNPMGECLLSQIRAAVDQEDLAVYLKQARRAQAFIFGIVGRAHGARAANIRHPARRSGSQDRDLHTLIIWRGARSIAIAKWL